jgi:hypothetical protein
VATPPIFPLPIPMVELALRTTLVTPVGATALLAPGLLAATAAAVAMATVTGNANKKQGLTL